MLCDVVVVVSQSNSKELCVYCAESTGTEDVIIFLANNRVSRTRTGNANNNV